MFKSKILKIAVIGISIGLLSACGNVESNSKTNLLNIGKVYEGKNATHEVIEVKGSNDWIVKNDLKDSSNFNEVVVKDTGRKVSEFPIVNLKIDNTTGDINSSFGRKEGRDFILIIEGENLYFTPFSKNNEALIKDNLSQKDNDSEYLKSISNFEFTESK